MSTELQHTKPASGNQTQKMSASIGSSHRSHEVAALIEKAICDGVYHVGGKLPSEALLCSQYNVSRTVIREALKQLTGKGIIITRNGAGSYIATCASSHLGDTLRRIAATADEATALNLIDMWAMIESGCIRKFVGHPEQIEQLEAVLALMHRALALRDEEAFIRTDIEFHRTIIAGCGNDLMSEVHKAVDSILWKRIPNLTSDDASRRLILLEHEEVVAAVRDGDDCRAAKLMMNHIHNSEQRMFPKTEVKIHL